MPSTSAANFCAVGGRVLDGLGHVGAFLGSDVPTPVGTDQHSSDARTVGAKVGREPAVRYLDVKLVCLVGPTRRPPSTAVDHIRSRRTHGQDHLHPHRRSTDAGDVLAAAHRLRLRADGRRRGRDPRHLPRRAHHRPVPRPAHRGAAPRRRPRRAGRAGHQARGQHHQAAQHLRLHPAAQGRGQGAAGQGLRPARLPGEPADRRGAATPARSTTRSRAPRSTRSCARATPTAARPRA